MKKILCAMAFSTMALPTFAQDINQDLLKAVEECEAGAKTGFCLAANTLISGLNIQSWDAFVKAGFSTEVDKLFEPFAPK